MVSVLPSSSSAGSSRASRCVRVVIGHTGAVNGRVCKAHRCFVRGVTLVIAGLATHALDRHLHRHAVSRPPAQGGEHQQQDNDQDTHERMIGRRGV